MDTAERGGPAVAVGGLRWVVLAVVGVAVVLVASSDALYGLVVRGLEAVAAIIAVRPVLGALLFVVASGVSAMLAFVSSAVLVPVAVYAWGKTVCMVLLWLGWIFGGLAAYGVGRSLGRPVVARLVPAATRARLEDRLSRRTPFGVVLLFQLALPSEVPGYLLGMVRYGLGRYLAVLALAELPWAVGTTWLGAGFLERQVPLVLLLGGAGLAITALLLRVLRRWLAR
jgi:uncharacterized membrane protein YdjX (TVP38/TMEM64 family)